MRYRCVQWAVPGTALGTTSIPNVKATTEYGGHSRIETMSAYTTSTTADDRTLAREAASNAMPQATPDTELTCSGPESPFQAGDSAYNGHSGAVSPVQRRSSVGRARDS